MDMPRDVGAEKALDVFVQGRQRKLWCLMRFKKVLDALDELLLRALALGKFVECPIPERCHWTVRSQFGV